MRSLLEKSSQEFMVEKSKGPSEHMVGRVCVKLLSLWAKLHPMGPVAHPILQIKRNKNMSVSRLLSLSAMNMLDGTILC